MTPAPALADWPQIRDLILNGRAAEGVSQLADAAAPWRLEGDRLVRQAAPPDAIERSALLITTGRHAGWFETRLPALAEQGWTAALVTLGWRAALRHDAQGAADYAAAVTGHAASAPEDVRGLLQGGGRFLHWLAYDLSRRFAFNPPVGRPAMGPLYFRGDMREVGVVGGAEFTEMSFDSDR